MFIDDTPKLAKAEPLGNGTFFGVGLEGEPIMFSACVGTLVVLRNESVVGYRKSNSSGAVVRAKLTQDQRTSKRGHLPLTDFIDCESQFSLAVQSSLQQVVGACSKVSVRFFS